MAITIAFPVVWNWGPVINWAGYRYKEKWVIITLEPRPKDLGSLENHG